jgi:hypothetical protein
MGKMTKLFFILTYADTVWKNKQSPFDAFLAILSNGREIVLPMASI